MRKLLVLILCLAVLVTMVACDSAAEETTAPSEEAHNHIGYKGQTTIFAPDMLESIEGRECDFTYDQNGKTIYIFNNVTVDEMAFTQVQFTFNENHNRISCTYSAKKSTEENPRSDEEIAAEIETALSGYEASLSGLYGEGSYTEQNGYKVISWRDHTENYIILTQINATTVQVAYYIYAK